MKVPSTPFGLMRNIYKMVLPKVHSELAAWKEKARKIPDEELRKQAVASIEAKTFHCEGGSIHSLLAGQNYQAVIEFVVAYQTISDYLDNLCDRSVSLNPDDFRALHESMMDALTPGAPLKDYYRFRDHQGDGGYLPQLVLTCQQMLANLPSLKTIQPSLHELAGYYCDLQVHKHVKHEERVPRLQHWFAHYEHQWPDMQWQEFSASSGSTLGIFCIVSYAANGEQMDKLVPILKSGYFPWVQGLHILLDYFIDQEEDRIGGDLNFCFYYDNEDVLLKRLNYFIEKADQSIQTLPDRAFHRMINRGLMGIYLADQKVAKQRRVRVQARKMMRKAGGSGMFFFLNGWLYRRLKPGL
ncbi:tetraprenyl-beta-curcumene synthase family protein [Tuberibacillus sp. Marseille-P3662]|uniref:tetraprenyl-beta-curcumene synthase family protein n=1 Tax=Tuberibacillus sp. Marseille-P3662 TaxID=1965358 RepID=UPI000A1C9EC2|nr:tetraprenyl-beta-curcumene synthase family protein [Tuberibacillus sp. Marseille-P3662]